MLSELQLEQLLWCLTGLSPKISVKDLDVKTRCELTLGWTQNLLGFRTWWKYLGGPVPYVKIVYDRNCLGHLQWRWGLGGGAWLCSGSSWSRTRHRGLRSSTKGREQRALLFLGKGQVGGSLHPILFGHTRHFQHACSPFHLIDSPPSPIPIQSFMG